IKSLNRAEVLDGVAIAAQAAMARTNKDLFIASPLELAQSCRVMIGGLATLTECLLVLHARRRWLAVIGRAASPSETARVNIVAQVGEEVKWPKIKCLKIDLESRVRRHQRTAAGWMDGCVAPLRVATSMRGPRGAP